MVTPIARTSHVSEDRELCTSQQCADDHWCSNTGCATRCPGVFNLQEIFGPETTEIRLRVQLALHQHPKMNGVSLTLNQTN
ncbi:hypothetical protein HETIRDRAFT_409035 [Heterobasidion irregulare TC 32-1]|uniref:Uncharacterized protein n=1 Tax=Heterobasidion irregulare (strain TC 32-1) TaxID=747525 RepID=W4KBG2_HETIT|nr:uncharacterized protein HETIRDRAFT_409035 [Heterobasidion irregulare TC 32-1]ETW83069.1 hypothetical protein HETIRDRAFT_409035 [Heterobasidion irregulare TC 32-1]